MCGPAVIPVLKFIAPMVLPSLAQRIFGGGNKQGDAQPAFKQTAAPGTKLAGAQSQLGEDEEARDETKASETEQSVNQRLSRKRQSDPNQSTGASDAPAASGLGGNISGGSQQTGGIVNPTLSPAYS